jgi:hypothetical protein
MRAWLCGLRGLAFLVLLACSTQAAVVVAHHPTSSLASESRGGREAGTPHDPTTCGVCQAVSQVRAQSCAQPILSIALPARIELELADLAAALPPLRFPIGHASRAPPRAPIA